jgi:YHS domain-containing protein
MREIVIGIDYRTRRSERAFNNEHDPICPVCKRKLCLEMSYWREKRKGEDVSYRSRIFCSNACKQKAYRSRWALERNASQNPHSQ